MMMLAQVQPDRFSDARERFGNISVVREDFRWLLTRLYKFFLYFNLLFCYCDCLIMHLLPILMLTLKNNSFLSYITGAFKFSINIV